MLKRIGAEEGGEFKAVASGTLPCGKPVVVNADGTVSVVSSTAVSQALGSAEVFESAATSNHNAAYDSHNQRVVLAYRDGGNSNQGTAIVGTVNANNTITYGTAVVFETGSTDYINVLFDSTNNKIVIIFRDVGDSNKAKGIVGTVDPSDNSISFGSASSGFAASTVDELSAAYTTNGKVVAAYKDSHNSNYGNSNVGTVSGTSITFGSSTYFESGAVDKTSVGYDTANDKVLIFYVDTSNSGYPTAIVGTVSGTSISYGTAVVVQSSEANISVAQAYDTDQQKFGLFYKAQSEGKAAVATISGTSVTASLKTPLAAFENNAPRYISAVYHQASKKIVVAYEDDGDSFKGKIALPQISGTNMLDPDGTMPSSGGQGSPVIFDTSSLTEKLNVVYDSVNKKAVIAYSDGGNSEHGTSVVFTPSYNDNNITSENYIGMSRGVAFPGVSGTKVSFESSTMGSEQIGAAYDTNAGKIVLAYQDEGNSYHGTAVVGTVSGTTISFGTPVVFEAAKSKDFNCAYDANAQKVVIAFCDEADSDKGKALVGTVSGTSISFGSEATFNSGATTVNALVYDANAQKVVVVYRDQGNSNRGTAAVGTVSGTSISFGAEALFNGNNGGYNAGAVYDANAQKILIGVTDTNNSSYGTAVVGTISGTDITFGSATVFISSSTVNIFPVFDPVNNKSVITFDDAGDGNKGKAVVGTISGTSVSFGSVATYNSSGVENRNPVYHTATGQIIFNFNVSGSAVAFSKGTVSGTSIGSFSSSISYYHPSNRAIKPEAIEDPVSGNVVFSWKDLDDSSKGSSLVRSIEVRGEVADGGNASIDIIGSVSDNQGGLTAGQQYFVQTDGTIGTTAATPSVLAGTAISATELLVKT